MSIMDYSFVRNDEEDEQQTRPSDTAKPNESKACIPVWAIILIVVGVLVVVGLALGLGLGLGLKKKEETRSPAPSPVPDADGADDITYCEGYDCDETFSITTIIENHGLDPLPITNYGEPYGRSLSSGKLPDGKDSSYDFDTAEHDDAYYYQIGSWQNSVLTQWTNSFNAEGVNGTKSMISCSAENPNDRALAPGAIQPRIPVLPIVSGIFGVIGSIFSAITAKRRHKEVMNKLNAIEDRLISVENSLQNVDGKVTQLIPTLTDTVRMSPCGPASAVTNPSLWYWAPSSMTAYYSFGGAGDRVEVGCNYQNSNDGMYEAVKGSCVISVACQCPTNHVHQYSSNGTLTLKFKKFHSCYAAGYYYRGYIGAGTSVANAAFKQVTLPMFMLGVGPKSEELKSMQVCQQNKDHEWWKAMDNCANTRMMDTPECQTLAGQSHA